jgi:hypothetical protein
MPRKKVKSVRVEVFPAAKSPEEFAVLRRKMKIQEHRNAIVAIEATRALMGDEWADRSIGYRVLCLEKLGVKP